MVVIQVTQCRRACVLRESCERPESGLEPLLSRRSLQKWVRRRGLTIQPSKKRKPARAEARASHFNRRWGIGGIGAPITKRGRNTARCSPTAIQGLGRAKGSLLVNTPGRRWFRELAPAGVGGSR
jgi:hypothetical protein